MATKTGYILGLSRGHNAGVCLLKDGEIVFAIEEERFTRQKYDGSPFAAMMKIKEYTDKVDVVVISHTQSLEDTAGKIDYIGDDIYTGMARKLGLIDRKADLYNHPQIIDLSHLHHKIHAACAFYRSGFDEAAAVIIDGAGTGSHANVPGIGSTVLWEVESIFDCTMPNYIKTIYKHFGTRDPVHLTINNHAPSERFHEEGTHVELVSAHAGITKVYEAVTDFCWFQAIEAGKTMGLFPYGKPNENIPDLFTKNSRFPLSDANVIKSRYPNGAMVNYQMYEELLEFEPATDLTKFQNRRDLAYACQKQTQSQALDLILTASKLTGKK